MAKEDRSDVRARIVAAAAAMLEASGPDSVTTRAVAEATRTQPPTIYRLFGDKDGLLEAVAEHVMATHVAVKELAVTAAGSAGADPVEDLTTSWHAQVAFGLAHPDVFRLLSDPARVARSDAARAGRRVLEQRVRRVAAIGRLGIQEERALGLLQASAIGAVQTLLATPVDARPPGLPDDMLAAVLDRMLVDGKGPAESGPARTTVAFRTLVPDLPGLSESERTLLTEWVDRALDRL